MFTSASRMAAIVGFILRSTVLMRATSSSMSNGLVM
jgi:hypothetical protein